MVGSSGRALPRNRRVRFDSRGPVARPRSSASYGAERHEPERGAGTMNVLDRFRLDNKVAIVTGASSGLGVTFATALAEAGADVALGARRADRMTAVVEAVEALGRRAVAVQTDVTDPDAAKALVSAAVE